jgi:DNA mismatch repair protein MutH
MPNKDIEIAREFWIDTKDKIVRGDYNHFIKISDKRICHVRTKSNPNASKNRDMMETPQNTLEKKRCYWLNASYIREQIEAPENN